MEALKDKITKASKSANAGFKRKKIRSMKREADKIVEKLAESEAKLESMGPSSCRLWHGSRAVILKIEKSQYITCF